MLWFKKRERLLNTSALAYAPNSSFNYLTEAFKGLVSTKRIKFPAELGEEHPFDFSICEKLCIIYGIVSAIVDKHIDFIMSSGISVKSKNKKAEALIEQFMIDFNFDVLLRQWFREAFIKGNGFIEISESSEIIDGLKVLDAKHIYIDRDVTGEIKGYNQYSKALKDWTNMQEMQKYKDVVNFKNKEIAHLALNVYGDKAYGYGIIYQLISIINDLIGSRKEMHILMKRKANNPLIFLMGDREKGEMPTAAEMEALGQKLEQMHNQTEWTLSDMVKPMVLDFGQISEKFAFIIENDLEVLYMAAQIPAILMGKASVAEGLGETQGKAWLHRINSVREDAEKVIENDIFKRYLNSQGIDEHVEIVWGMPSEEEKREKAKVLITALQNPFMNEGLRQGMEEELAKIFDIEEERLIEAKEERKEEETKQQVPVLPEEKESLIQRSNASHIHESYTQEELEILDKHTVEEWIGFSLPKYKNNIKNIVNNDRFEKLRATTKAELKAGLLSSNEIDRMRNVFYDAFEKNYTIRGIKNELNRVIEFKDRLRIKNGSIVADSNGNPILSLHAKDRAIMIARTETVRLSGLGAIENYKDAGINKVIWRAAVSQRTCEYCNSLNGNIYPINNVPEHPAHVFCRCALSPYTELK